MTIRTLILVFVFIWAGLPVCNAQSNPRYFVLFKDKANSPFSTASPTQYLSQRAVTRRTRQNIQITENDLPVNPAYIAAVKQTGAQHIFSSRWFNGIVVEASSAQLEAIKKLSFYKGIELNLPIANLSSKSAGIERSAQITAKFGALEDIDYGKMKNQLLLLGVDVLHNKGIHGENMMIAVFDEGFASANTISYFKHIFDEKRLTDTYNFLSRKTDVYAAGEHGRSVLSAIAAYQPGELVGPAFKASFALYTTESIPTESPYEEVTWLMAAERADSVGVDVINSSLGYTDFDGEFNTPAYNYTYAMMDGKTTIISRAARIASRKGMIVVNAAGNEGNKAWKYVVAPADVDSVLTVGASDYQRNYASLSSIGPNAANQLKPDVAAVGSGTIVGNAAGTASSGSGTSYASPQIAGLAAILWQAYPNLNSQKVISVLKRSGHQASSPDQLLGYGVPDVTRAQDIILSEFPVLGTEPELLQSITLSPNPANDYLVVSFPGSLSGKTTSLAILSSSGVIRTEKKLTIEENLAVDISKLPPGLYLLRINLNERTRVIKFIKK